MGKILITGSAGFIGGYLVQELIRQGHEVVGIDNYSKYGPVERQHDGHPAYRFIEGDARDVTLLEEQLLDCDHFIAAAAMIGGISYFHAIPYDLLTVNERITGAACDAAIQARRHGRLQKVTFVSSSMVYESVDRWPTVEGDEFHMPPPRSAYGFQKLAVEYHARAAWDQYRLPYTIVRPYNVVGLGESRALGASEVKSGNIEIAMSHVVPDLVQKVLKGQDPLHILGDGNQVRHYTYGGDLAKGIALAIEKEEAWLEDFNLSTATPTTVRELASLIWRKLKGDTPLVLAHDEPFPHDVQQRTPDVSKARNLLGFEARTGLDEMLDEVIPWVQGAIDQGRI